jgi:hypothetical protein
MTEHLVTDEEAEKWSKPQWWLEPHVVKYLLFTRAACEETLTRATETLRGLLQERADPFAAGHHVIEHGDCTSHRVGMDCEVCASLAFIDAFLAGLHGESR